MSATPAFGTDLTARELEVLRLAAEGLSDAEIAEKLHLSRHTVKTHLARILGRLGARTRAHAVAVGYERELLRTPWDPGRADAQVHAVRVLAARWAGLQATTGRDAVLRDAGRALLKVLDGAAPGERP